MKKIIAIALSLALLAAMTVSVWAGNPVQIQVLTPDGQLLYTTAELGDQTDVLSVLQKVLKEVNVNCIIAESAYGGSYVDTIGDLQAGTYGGYDGWLYYVDGISPLVGISEYALAGGEFVQVIYADFDVLVPVVAAQRDRAGIVTISITADVSTYDENWNVTVTREPVADATVTVDGETYTTDAEGKVVLSAALSAKETVSVQVGKKNAVGLPALLALHPEYKLALAEVKAALPFSDLAEGQWYTEPVLQMADLGVVNGMPDGTFRPEGTVTRAQVANMLYKLSGGVPVNYLMTFSDVAEGQWYTEAVRWAASEGIVTGSEGKFRPDDAVTRQDLAVMLVRYQEKVVKTALPEVAEAPAFADNADIASYAAEAVYLLQKAGIVSGDNGKFLPTATATRGALCKMLSGLVVSD